MLPALLLVLGLGQPPEPRLFLWTIIGLAEPGPNIVVTVTPTPFGLVSGFEVKAITIDLVPTRADPKPRAIRPLKTEPAPRWGLQAIFTKPPRRFHLKLTLADGSVQDLDIYAPPPPDEPKEFQSRPLQLISHRANWGD
jgi:hypothetical protein